MKRSLTAAMTVALVCASFVVLAAPAAAHETAKAGDLALEVGWTRPAYMDH